MAQALWVQLPLPAPDRFLGSNQTMVGTIIFPCLTEVHRPACPAQAVVRRSKAEVEALAQADTIL